MKKILLLTLTILTILTTTIGAFAHSGRTDSAGGHKDNQNRSGLGSYHYHCSGNPAHLHENGVCPYRSGGTASASTSSTAKPAETPAVTAKTGKTDAEKAASALSKFIKRIKVDLEAQGISMIHTPGTNTIFKLNRTK